MKGFIDLLIDNRQCLININHIVMVSSIYVGGSDPFARITLSLPNKMFTAPKDCDEDQPDKSLDSQYYTIDTVLTYDSVVEKIKIAHG